MDPVNPAIIETSVDHAAEPVVRRRLGGIVWFALALGAVWVTLILGSEIGAWWEEVSSILASPEAFRVWVEDFGARGPVVYLLAQAAQVIVVPIPGSLFPPVGALAFGPWPAFGLSLAGIALGSAVVFLVARRWGRPLAARLVGADRIHRYQSLMTGRGGLLLWLVFLLPLLPDDAICALAGLSAVSFRRFMLIATVGRIPAVAAGGFAMAGLEGAPAWVWALAGSVFALLLWAGFRYGPSLERILIHRMGRDPRHRMPPSQSSPVLVSPREEGGPADRLVPIMTVVVLSTLAGVVVGVLAGVSGLTTAAILVWGVILAVVVASARGAD